MELLQPEKSALQWKSHGHGPPLFLSLLSGYSPGVGEARPLLATLPLTSCVQSAAAVWLPLGAMGGIAAIASKTKTDQNSPGVAGLRLEVTLLQPPA